MPDDIDEPSSQSPSLCTPNRQYRLAPASAPASAQASPHHTTSGNTRRVVPGGNATGTDTDPRYSGDAHANTATGRLDALGLRCTPSPPARIAGVHACGASLAPLATTKKPIGRAAAVAGSKFQSVAFPPGAMLSISTSTTRNAQNPPSPLTAHLAGSAPLPSPSSYDSHDSSTEESMEDSAEGHDEPYTPDSPLAPLPPWGMSFAGEDFGCEDEMCTPSPPDLRKEALAIYGGHAAKTPPHISVGRKSLDHESMHSGGGDSCFSLTAYLNSPTSRLTRRHSHPSSPRAPDKSYRPDNTPVLNSVAPFYDYDSSSASDAASQVEPDESHGSPEQPQKQQRRQAPRLPPSSTDGRDDPFSASFNANTVSPPIAQHMDDEVRSVSGFSTFEPPEWSTPHGSKFPLASDGPLAGSPNDSSLTTPTRLTARATQKFGQQTRLQASPSTPVPRMLTTPQPRALSARPATSPATRLRSPANMLGSIHKPFRVCHQPVPSCVSGLDSPPMSERSSPIVGMGTSISFGSSILGLDDDSEAPGTPPMPDRGTAPEDGIGNNDGSPPGAGIPGIAFRLRGVTNWPGSPEWQSPSPLHRGHFSADEARTSQGTWRGAEQGIDLTAGIAQTDVRRQEGLNGLTAVRLGHGYSSQRPHTAPATEKELPKTPRLEDDEWTSRYARALQVTKRRRNAHGEWESVDTRDEEWSEKAASSSAPPAMRSADLHLRIAAGGEGFGGHISSQAMGARSGSQLRQRPSSEDLEPGSRFSLSDSLARVRDCREAGINPSGRVPATDPTTPLRRQLDLAPHSSSPLSPTSSAVFRPASTMPAPLRELKRPGTSHADSHALAPPRDTPGALGTPESTPRAATADGAPSSSDQGLRFKSPASGDPDEEEFTMVSRPSGRRPSSRPRSPRHQDRHLTAHIRRASGNPAALCDSHDVKQGRRKRSSSASLSGSSETSTLVTLPPELGFLRAAYFELWIDQEGFRSIRPAFWLVRCQAGLSIHSLGHSRSASGSADHRGGDVLLMQSLAEFKMRPRETYNFHHAALDSAPVLRRLTVNGDETKDYLSRQASLSVKSNGVYTVSASEKGGMEWKFEYFVQDRISAVNGKSLSGEKTLTPLSFSCSPELLSPDRGKKIHLFHVMKKSVTPKLVSSKLNPPSLPTPPQEKPVAPAPSPTAPAREPKSPTAVTSDNATGASSAFSKAFAMVVPKSASRPNTPKRPASRSKRPPTPSAKNDADAVPLLSDQSAPATSQAQDGGRPRSSTYSSGQGSVPVTRVASRERSASQNLGQPIASAEHMQDWAQKDRGGRSAARPNTSRGPPLSSSHLRGQSQDHDRRGGQSAPSSTRPNTSGNDGSDPRR